MNRMIVLDAGPLGMVTQRRGVKVADRCRQWMENRLLGGDCFLVPEIADYEVRRELLRAGKSAGLARLDEFIAAESGRYLPITTQCMRLAAQYWCDARRLGQPTAPDAALDCDCILAAQAATLQGISTPVIVATTNVGHLNRFVAAALWDKMEP